MGSLNLRLLQQERQLFSISSRVCCGTSNLEAKVSSRSFSSVPAVVAVSGNSLQLRKASLSQKIGTGGSENLHRRSLSLASSSHLFPSKGTLRFRSQSTRLRFTSLRTVATHSNSNGHDLSSSNHATNSTQDLRLALSSAVDGLTEGLRNLNEKRLQSSKGLGFKEVYSRLKVEDGNSLFEKVRLSEIKTEGGKAWQTADSRIKWPLAIFGGAYLIVLIAFGAAVAQELIPLWILGPIITGLVIRSVYLVADLIQQGSARSKPLRQRAMRETKELWEDAKTGELKDKLSIMIHRKNTELTEEAARKRVDFEAYVKSGQAAADFKVFVLLKLSQFNEWAIDRYEDFWEWLYPIWRVVGRLSKKIF